MQIRHTHTERPITDWLPTTKKEVESRGWEQFDVIIIYRLKITTGAKASPSQKWKSG